MSMSVLIVKSSKSCDDNHIYHHHIVHYLSHRHTPSLSLFLSLSNLHLPHLPNFLYPPSLTFAFLTISHPFPASLSLPLTAHTPGFDSDPEDMRKRIVTLEKRRIQTLVNGLTALKCTVSVLVHYYMADVFLRTLISLSFFPLSHSLSLSFSLSFHLSFSPSRSPFITSPFNTNMYRYPRY